MDSVPPTTDLAVAVPYVASVVVDCESGPVRLGLAAQLGLQLGGQTLRLEELGADHLAGVVRGLPEGLAGITALHELVAEHLDPAGEPDQVQVGIETERGPWVQALVAAGYVVYAINPMQVARYR